MAWPSSQNLELGVIVRNEGWRLGANGERQEGGQVGWIWRSVNVYDGCEVRDVRGTVRTPERTFPS